jgi:O-acetyl-ADP-ribose deacetylase (regulator of RNase III)
MAKNAQQSREERRARFIDMLRRRDVFTLIDPLERKLGAYRDGKLSAEDLFKTLHAIMVQSDKVVKRYRNRPDVVLAEIAMDENKYTTDINEIGMKARLGDITTLFADAIVNPADPSGAMTAGAAAAIKAAGGEEIEREALSQAPITVEKPIATTPGRLPILYVIHVAVSREAGGASSPEMVRKAAAAALALAEELGVESVAFPALGTGAGGVSPEDAAAAIVQAVAAHAPNKLADVTLVGRDERAVAAFVAALERWDEEHG